MNKIPFAYRIVIFLFFFFMGARLSFAQEPLEKIKYAISPVGNSEYQYYGPTQMDGKKLNLVVFKTKVATFDDTEKIYSDPNTGLPVKTERFVSMWPMKEYITEDYIHQENRLVIKKYEGGKKTAEYLFKATGPIHNAVLLPFSLRKVPELNIGWTMDIRLPAEFKVRLSSIEEVVVPAGKFMAYHFTSVPPKFEIWISKDSQRVPLKIKGLDVFPYTLLMKERSFKEENK